MLRSNIDVSKGLENGEIGCIIEILWLRFRCSQTHTDEHTSSSCGVLAKKSKQSSAKYSYGTTEKKLYLYFYHGAQQRIR